VNPTSIIDSVDSFQRRRPLPAVTFGVIKRFGESGAGSLAATIAYYGFFSLFPLLLVFVSITGFILKSRPDLQHELLNSALAQFPVVGAQIRGNVGSIQGSGLALAIGLLLALWSGIGGVRAAENALDTVGDVQRSARRGAVASVGMALVMLVALGAFLLGGAFLAGIASQSNSWISSLGLIASGLLNVALFATAYRVLVSETLRWSTVAPGAILAGIGWTALLILGSRLVTAHIASASEMYGTFAIVIGLLGWIYLGAQLMLVGAELNVVLAQRLWPRSLRGALVPADEAALRRSAMQEQRNPQEQVSVEFRADPSSEHEDRVIEPPEDSP
jgi:YihY family inner membrane protein